MRYKKIVDGNTTDYYLDGTKILGENRIGHGGLILYFYDETGIAGMRYQGAYYYFEKNLLGDVVGIYDMNNDIVACYSYDAWGNLIYKIGTMADVNPFRYRGYYFDEETGFYYLQSRYYDPSIRLFISADDRSIIGTLSQTAGEINLYAYCGNNPVNYKQRPVFSGGSITDSALSGTLGGGSSIFNSVLANGSFRNGLFFGKGTVTGLYASGHARAQISLKNGKFVLGAFGKFSLLNATGQIGIGNDDFSVSLVGVGDICTVSAMAGILIDPSKNTYFAGIEAKAAVFTARGGVQFEIFTTQIEVGGSVSALSAGFQFGVGIKDGEFYYKIGFAVLFGYDSYIRIKFA